MEKRWFSSIGFILLLVLLVFAVGYSSGNSPTGLGIFDRLTSRSLESSTANINVRAVCGNGIVESNEVCDDGNSISGDGCYNCRLSFTVRGVETSGRLRVERDENRLSDRDDLEPDTKFVGGSGLGALTIDAARINPEFLVQLRSINPCETFTVKKYNCNTGRMRNGVWYCGGVHADSLQLDNLTVSSYCLERGYNTCVNALYYEEGETYASYASCSATDYEILAGIIGAEEQYLPPAGSAIYEPFFITFTCCNL